MKIPELTAAENSDFLAVVERKKDEASPESEAKKECYIDENADRLAEQQNISVEEAKEALRARTAGTLLPSDMLHFQTFGKVAVTEVMANPAQYDKKYCADPWEPEEGPSKALFFANQQKGTPLVHSMLHGGHNFLLRNEAGIQQEGEGQRTKKDVMVELTAAIADGDIHTDQWCRLVAGADLSQSAIDDVIDFLATTTGAKKTSLKRDFQNHLHQAEVELDHEALKDKAGDRLLIKYEEHDLNGIVALVEKGMLSKPGEWPYFSYGGELSYSTNEMPGFRAKSVDKEKPPTIPVIRQYNRDNLALRIEQSCTFYKTKMDKARGTKRAYLIGVPQQVVNKLYEHPEPLAPKVWGLVTHPVVDMSGRVIVEEGIDEDTGLLLQFGGCTFDLLPHDLTQERAKAAAGRVIDTLFREFNFKESPKQDELYKTSALAMLHTGIMRKVVDTVPGFLVAANVQGTGKTSLARMCHVTLSGKDMPVSSLGGNSEEVKKEMMATLLQSPGMICYDNILDGSEVNDATVAKVITSTEYKGRILGKTQEATVPTNTLMVLTGNNVTLATDLVRRFITVSLTADSERPETKVYEQPDIVQHCIKNRHALIRECLTITKAYIDAGCPLDSSGLKGSGFQQWDRMVRFPLLWATGVDVLFSMEENREQSSQHMAMVKVLNCLNEIYGSKRFTASNVMRAIECEETGEAGVADSLREGLVIMSRKALRSIKSLAWVLKALEGRIIDEQILRRDQCRNRSDEYWIETKK